jgi:Fic family protein
MNNPGRLFTVKEIANHYDVSENTARKYLKELVTYKILGALKEGRTVNYIAMANIKEVL